MHMTTNWLLIPTLLLALTATGCDGCRANANNAKHGKKHGAPSSSSSSSSPEGPPDPPKPFVQRGVPDGKVICGYVQDNADASKCSAVVDAPAGKEVFARAGDHYAQIVKGHVVPSCPTDYVVGACDNGMGLVTNYSGPKWNAERAKKDCTKKSANKWLD
jgi:hypothetical protein